MAKSSANDRGAELSPYLQPLLYDRKVQDAVRRAAREGQETYRRARGKPAAKAMKDKRLRRRAQATAAATWQVWVALDAAQARRRRRWRRRLLLVPVVAAAAYGAYVSYEQ
jgi:hypothetical protein